MANAKKCDVCGRLYEIYNVAQNEKKSNGFMYLNIDACGKYYAGKVTDCCPECMDKIKNFVNKLKIE